MHDDALTSTPGRASQVRRPEESVLVDRAAAQRRVLRALRTSQVFGGIGQAAGGSAGALLARDITGTDAQAGWPQACVTLGAAAAALVVSAAAQRTSRRRALAGALTAGAIGGALGAASASADSLTLLVLGCLLLGAGNAAAMLSRYAAADLAHPENRAKAIASVLVASSVGAVAGANLIGVVAPISSIVGLPVYAGPYLVAATTYAVASGLTLSLLRPDPLALARRQPAPGVRDVRPVRCPPRWVRPENAAGLLGLSFANLVMMGLMTPVPLELIDMDEGLGVVGGVVSLHIAAMFAPSPVSGRVADRLGAPRALILSAMLLLAASLSAIVGRENTVPVTMALILLGIGWNVALVAGSVMLTAEAPPEQRPQLEAVGEVAMGLAGAVGSAVSGPVVLAAGYTGLGVVCAAASATMLLVPLLELRLFDRRPAPPRPGTRMIDDEGAH